LQEVPDIDLEGPTHLLQIVLTVIRIPHHHCASNSSNRESR